MAAQHHRDNDDALRLVPVHTVADLADRNHFDETISRLSNAMRRLNISAKDKRTILTKGKQVDTGANIRIRGIGVILLGDVGDPLDFTSPVIHFLHRNNNENGGNNEEDPSSSPREIQLPYTRLRTFLRYEAGKMSEQDAKVVRSALERLLVNSAEGVATIPSLYVSRDGYQKTSAAALDALNDTLAIVHVHTREEEVRLFRTIGDDDERNIAFVDPSGIAAMSVYYVFRTLGGALPPSRLEAGRTRGDLRKRYFAWAPIGTLQNRLVNHLISNHPEWYSERIWRFVTGGGEKEVRIEANEIPFVARDDLRVTSSVDAYGGPPRRETRRQPMMNAVGELSQLYTSQTLPPDNNKLFPLLLQNSIDIFVLATAFKIQVSPDIYNKASHQLSVQLSAGGRHKDFCLSACCRDDDGGGLPRGGGGGTPLPSSPHGDTRAIQYHLRRCDDIDSIRRRISDRW